jgi:hypothetical protein
MKRLLLIAASFLLVIVSCERNSSNQDPDPDDKPDPEVFFKIGSSLSYKYSDLELYDSSTHIMYFKTNHSEFDSNSASPFAVISDCDTVYQGDFWPSFRSDLPTRPYISTWPFRLQDHALWIENRDDILPDLRNDPDIIQSFKDRNLLHSGLAVSINSLEITESEAAFSFSVTNKDQSSLWIMDPNKMGLNLFHYYTSGLVFWKSGIIGPPFYVNVPYQSPLSPDSWETGWFTILNSDDTETFTFNYSLDTSIDPGEYLVTFTFPGLSHQVSKDQLIQDNARIWLGEIKASIQIIVD